MERIDECISFLAGKAAQTVSRLARERLAPFGVTPVQYAVLQVLWEQDGQSGAEIGARLVLDSATITGVLDRLESLGLIERTADRADRRVQRIRLTAAGRLRRSRCRRQWTNSMPTSCAASAARPNCCGGCCAGWRPSPMAREA